MLRVAPPRRGSAHRCPSVLDNDEDQKVEEQKHCATVVALSTQRSDETVVVPTPGNDVEIPAAELETVSNYDQSWIKNNRRRIVGNIIMRYLQKVQMFSHCCV